jgi:hypothetical protein
MSRYNCAEDKEKHNEQCRLLMKKNYDECNGKEKSILKYYKRKYKDDDSVMIIMNDKDLDICEKVKQIKILNFNKKMGI